MVLGSFCLQHQVKGDRRDGEREENTAPDPAGQRTGVDGVETAEVLGVAEDEALPVRIVETCK